MKFADATNINRKSGAAEWRDLWCATRPSRILSGVPVISSWSLIWTRLTFSRPFGTGIDTPWGLVPFLVCWRLGKDWFAAVFGKQRGESKGVESGGGPLMTGVGRVMVILRQG